MTIVLWCHLVSDIDLCCSPKSPKSTRNPLFWRSRSFSHWIRRQSRASVRLPISD